MGRFTYEIFLPISKVVSLSISNMLEQIKNDEIVLPAIQRDFVWEERRIENLFDSIMRGYPIGIVFLWETYEDIQYRKFIKDFIPDTKHIFHDNEKHNRLKIVLDGQQRLQSIYLSIYGSHEGKFLCFDILSGEEDNDTEWKYLFYFIAPDKLNIRNAQFCEIDENGNEIPIPSDSPEYLVRVNELLSMSAKERQKFKRDLSKQLSLTDDDILRVELNINTLIDALEKDNNILKTTTLDEDIPCESPDRKSESDVLEAFIRINRQGIVLTRSDLIFSMLKLNWKDSTKSLPEFVSRINEGNSFELTSDFVIRCLFAVSDLGTKFDVDLLRKNENVTKIKTNFNKCCDSIRSAIDFVQTECHISSSKLLGGSFNLVPFVYYIFHLPKHQIPTSEITNVKKAIYLFGFTSPFSRYADSRLKKFISDALVPLVDEHKCDFPLKRCVYWVSHWEHVEKYDGRLLQRNPLLALHLVQRQSGSKVHYNKNFPQIDHIFPRSKLREYGFEESEINHFANFWLLSSDKNKNKSDKNPKEFFKNIPDSELQKAYIDRTLLDYKKYRKFLKTRENQLLEHVKRELDLEDEDYSYSSVLLYEQECSM